MQGSGCALGTRQLCFSMFFCDGGIILVLKEAPASSYFLVYLARQYSRSRVRALCLSPLLNSVKTRKYGHGKHKLV
jgi:hypothetical protein